MGIKDLLEVPSEGKMRVALMKAIARAWTEPFRECIMQIPDDATVQNIRLEDFVPRLGLWENMKGRVTMVGEAAHAMTMCKLYLRSLFPLSI